MNNDPGHVVKLTRSDFSAYFRAIHGKDKEPFPWQERLLGQVLDHGWPDLCGLPTASGKTACIDIAVFALALNLQEDARRMPMRIIFVVDRRLVVDDARERAKLIAGRLSKALSEPAAADPDAAVLATVAQKLMRVSGAVPLQVATLRGGLPRDNSWVESAHQPTVVLSTVDQIGSRLLFRGYGVTSRMAPVHAGLLGEDCLLLLDEAHLSVPFAQTLDAVRRLRRRASSPLGLPYALVQLSATPVGGVAPASEFTLDMDRTGPDRAGVPVLDQRFAATKMARLARVPAAGGLEAQAKAFVDKALECAQAKKVVAVVVNRVRLARKIHEILSRRVGEVGDDPAQGGSLLLTGRCRPLERDMLLGLDTASGTPGRVIDRIRTGRDRGAQALHKPIFVVGTQSIEAGADLDFDALVTEMAPWPSLRQRFGRLDRAGELGHTEAWILCTFNLPAADPAAQDRVYGAAGWNTRQWLWKLVGGLPDGLEAPEGALDLGIDGQARVGAAPEGTSPSAPSAPSLPSSIMDLFAQTSPRPYPDPSPSLWLHGPASGSADIQVVWRADAPEGKDGEEWRRYAENVLSAMPPTSAEVLSLPFGAGRSWLCSMVADASDLEVEMAPDARQRSRNSAMVPEVFVWRGRRVEDGSGLVPADRLRPGDTVILPSACGGCDRFGWLPEPAAPGQAVRDIAAEAILRSRGRHIIRLHPALLPEADWNRVRTVVKEWEPEEEGEAVLVERLLRAIPDIGRRHLGAKPEVAFYPEGAALGGVVLVGQATARQTDVDVRTDLLDDDDLALLAMDQVPLGSHCQGVAQDVTDASRRVGLPEAQCGDLRLSGEGHDVGKAEVRFKALLRGEDVLAAVARPPLAKSVLRQSGANRLAASFKRVGLPDHVRHECWSVEMLRGSAALAKAHDPDLVLWLVGTHHGRGRPFFDPVDDPKPVFDRIQLMAELAGEKVRLDGAVRHDLADASSGWTDLFDRLQGRYGWWGLAYLEALLRLSDARRSREEAMRLSGNQGKSPFVEQRA
ncbi:type I-G CRISPR-associated helicase/endonuclease Cas3g [Teichococcus aestuarii]|uniref:type I-G CRISPR-associated helicase/endonuclease Cas3g n=1 Tax=Teichococcus aestuarii TaxID=568898 RepID=UPI0015E8216B|nr:type I-U CRISPR-associated helicase/endonuclease Cas3 [Pseudoroseomonas aestuarii]